ncbi:NAD-dependent epimerase/dehydratase family protein [Roseomonas nepalensis]|uniref:NAD-dependent epimerase/dehydratase family protein n=2 Tax=Muricoccus nepalensis TaxID=1854500 RepID=A0A502EIT6_9PROT|nr:NAD-dependent epimerase/dehydratase family protein [Roseomonas nepalensis]
MLVALRAAFPEAVLVGTARTGRAERVQGVDEVVALDLDEPSGLLDAVATARPDAVMHLAARADVGASFRNPMAFWRTNLMGTVALGEAVLRATPRATFILASSGEVYGLAFRAKHPVHENSMLMPANPYAASKAAADLAIGEIALRGLRAVRLRPFNHTGPGQRDGFVVSSFAHQIALIEAGRQKPVLRTGALDRWRDFLDVRDVCAAYVAALSQANSLVPGVVLNVCSGKPRRIGDILDRLLSLSSVAVEVMQEAARLRPTDVEHVVAEGSRGRTLLNWAPRIDWDETLGDLLASWRQTVKAAGPS